MAGEHDVIKKTLVAVSIMAIATYSFAGTECKGTVKTIAFHPTGGVLQVNAGYGTHYLCKLHETFNGVHPEICKSWYSMLLTAQASGRAISQYYNFQSGQSCETVGNWDVPNPMPYYVQLAN